MSDHNTDPREIVGRTLYLDVLANMPLLYNMPNEEQDLWAETTDKNRATFRRHADVALAALRDAGLLRDEPACGARWPVVEEVTCDLTQDHGGDHHGRIEDVEWYTSVDDAGEAIQ